MFDPNTIEVLTRLGFSLLIGLIIGAEREYKNKSAGLRTITLICLGSTLFTIVSIEVSHPSEAARIASNIVTGIGFLGAGAIMRDGLNVSGLTTASTIWLAAALGMAVGAGEFEVAIIGTVLALIVLTAFHYFQKILDRFNRTMDLHVVFDIQTNGIEDVEKEMKVLNIKFEKKKECRREGDVKYQYELSGNTQSLERLILYLVQQKEKVKAFEY